MAELLCVTGLKITLSYYSERYPFETEKLLRYDVKIC